MLKNRKKTGIAIKLELVSALKELSESTRVPQSKLMDEAIEDLLNKYKNKPSN